MSPIRTLIVDDEPLARRRIVQLLASAPDFVLRGECRSGAEAVAALAAPHAAEAPELVFLDVQMPDLSGLQVLERLPPPLPLVVFVTAYDRYTLQAFEAHAVDYLLKPIDPDRFARCLAHVRGLRERQQASQLHHHLADLLRLQAAPVPVSAPAVLPAPPPEIPTPPARQFLIKQQGRLYFVPADEVQYLEATGNYVTLHTQGQQHLMRTTLSQLAEQLDPRHFLRVHRSLIVQHRYIKELRPWAHGEYLVTLRNETHLTSSRSYGASIQRFLKSFVS